MKTVEQYMRDLWMDTRRALGLGPYGGLRKRSKPYNAHWLKAERRERRHPQDEGYRDTRRHKRVRVARAKRRRG